MHTMKMCWGSSGIDPLVFNDIVLKRGLHVAYGKNEAFHFLNWHMMFQSAVCFPIPSSAVLFADGTAGIYSLSTC